MNGTTTSVVTAALPASPWWRSIPAPWPCPCAPPHPGPPGPARFPSPTRWTNGAGPRLAPSARWAAQPRLDAANSQFTSLSRKAST
jgi:hypothetical protein